MSMLSLRVHGEAERLRDFFIELIGEMGFFVIHREDWVGGFRVIGADSRRTSPLVATIMNLFIGYIQRKRTAVELTGTQRGDIVEASLRCGPYLDVFDVDAPVEGPEERERCIRIAGFISERIAEGFGRAP